MIKFADFTLIGKSGSSMKRELALYAFDRTFWQKIPAENLDFRRC